MAKTPKKAAKAAPDAVKHPRGRGAILWWGGLGCGAMVVLSPGTAILLAALVVPVLAVALLPEDGVGGRVTLATLLFGLAASIQPLHAFWESDADLAAALGLVRQPLVLLTGWVAILGGWFVAEFSSVVLRLTAELKAATERRALMASLAELEEEWGPLAPLPSSPAA